MKNLPIKTQETVSEISFKIDTLEIVDEDTLSFAQILLKQCTSLIKDITAFCKPAVQATHKAHQAAKAQEKALLKLPEVAERLLRQKLRQYAKEETAKTAVVEKKMADKGMPVHVESPLDKGGFRTDWKWTLVDLTEVPLKYWTVNDAMISAEVKASKDKTNIPGIGVYSEKVPVAR